MNAFQTFALSLLLATGGAFAATAAPAPAPVASGVMPEFTHTWSPDEFVAGADVAAARVPLPSYATPDGKAFLDRFTSTDNYAALSDQKVSLAVRMKQSVAMFHANGRLLLVYAGAADHGQPLHAEVTALAVREMSYGSLNAILFNQWTVTANSRDPKLAAAKAQLGDGYAAVCMAVLKVIQNPRYLTPGDITYLLRSMNTSIVRMGVFFTPEARAQLRQQLTTQRAQLPAGDQQLVDQILQFLAK